MTIIREGANPDTLRREFDHYPTPPELAKAAIALLPNDFYPDRILDPGCGRGVWGLACKNRYGHSAVVHGVEYRSREEAEACFLPEGGSPYTIWHKADFLTWQTSTKFDLIVGNWPYGRNVYGNLDRRYAEKFARKSLSLLNDGGYVVALLRLGFVAGQRRAAGFWKEFPPVYVYVVPERPSFVIDPYINNKGKLVKPGDVDDSEYGLYIWRYGFQGETVLRWLPPYSEPKTRRRKAS